MIKISLSRGRQEQFSQWALECPRSSQKAVEGEGEELWEYGGGKLD
jgi:hypothetical protein